MADTDKVKEIHIISDSEPSIFNEKDKYVIPLYQRAFAWGEKQLRQLVEDIYYFDDSGNYYLGSLIVAQKNDQNRGCYFEVIDGQQRLSALYLLLTALRIVPFHSLTYAKRDKSNYTLENISSLLKEENNLDEKKIEETIQSGLSIIQNELSKTEYNKERLLANLKKVILFRITVPENTDLNRYFEIMNTRGEQLEQHDILKAQLMGYFDEDDLSGKRLFAEIWEACSDMTGYVQMHFSPRIRERLFGNEWMTIPRNWLHNEFSEKADKLYKEILNNKEAQESPLDIASIIKEDFEVKDETEDNDNIKRHFESIIDFPYFLIHCLKCFVKKNSLATIDDKPLIQDLMNDRKLVETFDGIINAEIIDKRQFSKEFIVFLLRARYLFDKYIIKREFKGEDNVGEWSLKELRSSSSSGSRKAHYTDTSFHYPHERWKTSEGRHKPILMIQSALRVSYTSPKVMHWITDTLGWLIGLVNPDSRIWETGDHIESIAKQSVKNFLAENPEKRFKMGVNTPHIVFNYLDYLLWKQNQKVDFTFEFRNSVEHWYPRNPSGESFEKWEESEGSSVDRFGNLCLVPSYINSKFSNMDPVSKKNTYKEMIQKGSLKLRLMSSLTTDSKEWKDTRCREHENAMIDDILRRNCPEIFSN